MNRFFRSALFPLFVIVLLVYLASQTSRTITMSGKNALRKKRFTVVWTQGSRGLSAGVIGLMG